MGGTTESPKPLNWRKKVHAKQSGFEVQFSCMPNSDKKTVLEYKKSVKEFRWIKSLECICRLHGRALE